MATITNRDGRWQAKVRRKQPDGSAVRVSRTFSTKREALDWSTQIEGKVTAREYRDRSKEQRDTLRVLLKRYEEEVTPQKRGARQEIYRIRQWHALELAGWPLVSVEAKDLAAWKRDRVDEGLAPSTINNALNLLSSVYKYAISEWGYALVNPCVGIMRVPARQPREASLDAAQESALLKACAAGPWYLPWMVRIALETAMRQGEIRRLRWEHVYPTYVHLPKTKNGSARDVPLTEEAEVVFEEFRRTVAGPKLAGWVFGDPDLQAADGGCTEWMVQQAFRNAVRSVPGLAITFHDLRHVAITRLVPDHTNVVELARTTGHKVVNQLLRYYNPTAAERANALRTSRRSRKHNG
jgi:integrase